MRTFRRNVRPTSNRYDSMTPSRNLTALRCLASALLVSATMATSAVAQTVSVGADAVSRYIWRGTDFGESFSIQPALAVSVGGFEIGSWASYAMSPESAGVNEHDLWIGYSVETASGSFSFGATDYYFPTPGGDQFFDFGGDGRGAHWIEPYAGYSGPESFPVTLVAAMFVHNDPDNSLYLEASYPVQLDGAELGLTLGAVAGESAFYGTEGFSVVNVGLSASKSIPLNDRVGLPVSVTYILNPDAERTFLVFGVGLSL